jgi:hypothetical protein
MGYSRFKQKKILPSAFPRPTVLQTGIPHSEAFRPPLTRRPAVLNWLTEKSIAHILFYRKLARVNFVRVAVRRGWSALAATNRRLC